MKEEIQSILENVRWNGVILNAKDFQIFAFNKFKENGFEVEKEVRVKDRGDGYSGRIDLIVRKEGKTCAIEIDRLSARRKSLFKVENYHADLRLVFIRVNGKSIWRK